MVNDAGYVVLTDLKNIASWCWRLTERPRRHLFRLRWNIRINQVFKECRKCEGSGSVDLTTGKPIGLEFNANATQCPWCRGATGYWRDRINP